MDDDDRWLIANKSTFQHTTQTHKLSTPSPLTHTHTTPTPQLSSTSIIDSTFTHTRQQLMKHFNTQFLRDVLLPLHMIH